jgi:PAS domain S-box-containing protein
MLRKSLLNEPYAPRSAHVRAWPSAFLRYGGAAAAVAVAAALHTWLHRQFGPMPPLLLFYPVVLLVAISAGRGPGILAIALSALCVDYGFIPPIGTFGVAKTEDFIALSVFIGMSLALSALAERLRIAKWSDAVARRQMELISVTMSSIGEGVIATDLESRVIFVNDAAESLLGQKLLGEQSLPLSSVFNTVDAATRKPITQLVESVLGVKSLRGYVKDALLILQDGREVPIELTGAIIRSEEGHPQGVVLTFRDCTERKHAEQEVQRLLAAVRAEKELLSLVLTSINEEVYFADTRKRYTFANPAALREFGHTTLEGMEVEKVVANLDVLRPDGRPRPIEEAPPLRALAGEVIHDEEHIVRTARTGEFRHRQVSSAPVRDASGTIIGSVSVVRDITELKRVEAALRDADHRKNVFLATLSHELRNPLAPIRTAALLLESPLITQEDLQRCRSIISRQVTHMASLLDDLLDISRFTRGELTLKKAYVPLRQILDGALEVAQPLIVSKQHRLHIETPRTPLMLDVDPVRLTQVVSNLLTNAAKYTDSGGDITLACRLEEDSLVIFVRDTGIGLASDLFTQVFEMFVQLPPAKDRAEGGLGIGLALVKGLVELHGGRIDVESPGRNRGSTFSVRLPRAVVVDESDNTLATSAATHAHHAKSHCVLIADDNPDGAESLAILLRLSGHKVHVAHDGSEALEMAARVKPDVALLDIGMPGPSGYEVATRMRREAWGRQMTLIAVTGWGQEEDKRRAHTAGFDHHFTKPMDPTALEAVFASI